MKIATSGKGGVGKTTIAAALIKYFAAADAGRIVYAIDADPDACLASAIGIPAKTALSIKPVIEMKEAIKERSGNGAFYCLNPRVDDFIDEYSYNLRNIRFMRMGDIKRGGSTCYCRENSFLSAVISSLLLDCDDIVIMDMGAGIEHLSRGTARGVDLMLVVVEPGRNSVNTARLVKKLASDLGIKNIKIVGNKIRNKNEKQFIERNFSSEEILGYIKFDDKIWERAMDESTCVLLEGKFFDSIKQVGEKILKRGGAAN